MGKTPDHHEFWDAYIAQAIAFLRQAFGRKRGTAAATRGTDAIVRSFSSGKASGEIAARAQHAASLSARCRRA
jgi:hypothetical protein